MPLSRRKPRLFIPIGPILGAALLFPRLMAFGLAGGPFRPLRHPRGLAGLGPRIQGLGPLPQLPQADELVLVLAAFLLAGDDDPARQMAQTHRALGLIDVLAALAA